MIFVSVVTPAQDELGWPLEFVSIYLDDYVSTRSWCDSPLARSFVSQVAPAVGVPVPSGSAVQGSPRFHRVPHLDLLTHVDDVLHQRLCGSTGGGAGALPADTLASLCAADVTHAVTIVTCALATNNPRLAGKALQSVTPSSGDACRLLTPGCDRLAGVLGAALRRLGTHARPSAAGFLKVSPASASVAFALFRSGMLAVPS